MRLGGFIKYMAVDKFYPLSPSKEHFCFRALCPSVLAILPYQITFCTHSCSASVPTP